MIMDWILRFNAWLDSFDDAITLGLFSAYMLGALMLYAVGTGNYWINIGLAALLLAFGIIRALGILCYRPLRKK